MVSKISILFLLVLFTFSRIEAQTDDYELNQAKMKQLATIDFTKKVVTRSALKDLNPAELQVLRGIVFGKRGRIFKERAIQSYLVKQNWYKPQENFSNAVLTATERKNIDLIRELEAESHDSVEPGDLRFWQTKAIPDEKIYAKTAAEWRIMIAEIEAIHGKTFADEEWLQKYFEERYWYKPNPNYTPTILTETERNNLQAFIKKRDEDRKVAVSVGDMDKFQTVPLTAKLLQNVSLLDLRLMRNEFFARRGKIFTAAAYKQVFEWQDWYKPIKDQSKVKLSAVELQNVKLIDQTEARIREQLSTQLLTPELVDGFYAEDLRNLRNEIFARRGRIFKSKDLQKYFEAQLWYRPNPDFKDDQLTEIEYKNIAVIKAAEESAVSKFVAVEG